jgi:hypothetical protein
MSRLGKSVGNERLVVARSREGRRWGVTVIGYGITCGVIKMF